MTFLKQLATKLSRRGAKPLGSHVRHLFRGGRYFLLARYSGDYDAASVGQMEREILAAFRKRHLDGLLMDFSCLNYSRGDDLLRPLSFHPDVPALDSEDYPSVDFTSLRPFPVAFIISNRNREGLTSLITHELFETSPEEVLFESERKAIEAMQTLLDKEGCTRVYPSLEEQRHTPRPAARVKCRKCPAMILEVTAATYHGTCPRCARTKGTSNRLRQFWDYICSCCMVAWMCLMLPFLLTFIAVRRVWRCHRFPFDKRSMLQGIQRYYPDRKEARNYLNGVIDGYWDCEPEHPTLCRPGMPRDFGMNAGGRLRRGEISPSEIP